MGRQTPDCGTPAELSHQLDTPRGVWVSLLAISLSLAATTPTQAQPPDSATDAYLDETARHLILAVRAARDTARTAIGPYTALVRERMGVSMSVSQRDRRLANGESVTFSIEAVNKALRGVFG